MREHEISFKDVGGNEEAKDAMLEMVDCIKNPEKYQQVGFNNPRGILLYGPPGTGKTMLAKAMANECEINFIHTCGSEFVELYVGNGARKVRDLFNRARKQKPCVIFIDEIEILGQSRNSQYNCKEADQTLNQLLSEMDGFEPSQGIIVIGATNQKHLMDEALLRPG